MKQTPVDHSQHDGFTLIEIIGVLAIMSIMAATIAPSAIRMITSSKQTAEDKALAGITTAIELYAQTNKKIPNENTWANDIAPLLNTAPSKVSLNGNNGNRHYIYPTDFFSAGNALPYNQNQSIATSKPLHAKIMVISNLDSGTPLAPAPTNAMAPATFDLIWNQTGQYATTADPLHEDNLLKIARIDLSSDFSQSAFTNQDANTIAIGVDGYTNNPITITKNLTLYLIKNTMLTLYADAAGNTIYSKQSVIPPTMTDIYSQGWSANGPANTDVVAGGTGIAGVTDGNGVFNKWAPKAGCVATNSAGLTIDNKTNSKSTDYYVFEGLGANSIVAWDKAGTGDITSFGKTKPNPYKMSNNKNITKQRKLNNTEIQT